MGFRQPGLARERAAQAASVLRSLVHADAVAPVLLEVAGPTDRIPYAQARTLERRPAALGDTFGPLWATYWLRVEGDVPAAWGGQRVDLLFNANAEAMLWREGEAVQGVSAPVGGTRQSAVLLEAARGGDPLAVEVQLACRSLMSPPCLLAWPGVSVNVAIDTWR